MDDFDDNMMDPTLWSLLPISSPGMNLAEQNGRLEFWEDAGMASCSGYGSLLRYDALDSEAVIAAAVLAPLVQMIASPEAHLTLTADGGHGASIAIDPYQVTALRSVPAGGGMQLGFAPYMPGTIRYLRLREAAGTLYFEHSLDGSSFTSIATTTTPPGFYAVQVRLQGCQVNSNRPPMHIVFEELNAP